MDDIDRDIDGMLGAGQGAAVGAVGQNPDKAAEAVKLSGTTGVPAAAIHQDLDGFKARTQQQVAGQVVGNNPMLGHFLATNPMAGPVSNDDLGTLDEVSGHATKLAEPSVWSRLSDGYHAAKDVLTQAIDSPEAKEDESRIYNYIDSPIWKGFARNLIAGGGLLNLAAAAPGAVTEGINAAAGRPAGLAGDLNVLMLAMGDPALHGPGSVPKELNDMAAAARKSHAVAEPYLMTGRPPPVGVDPIIDAGHLAQNQKDLAALNEALKTSQASTTRERAPGMYNDFIKQHTGDTIGVSHDAVRELYGSKVPSEGDGLLGFVPDLPSQLLRSTVTGTDIQIPISDWVTHVDPAVAKTLDPFVRTREGGITQAEADVLGQKHQDSAPITAYHGTDKEFDQFDSNAPTRYAARAAEEEGVSFHTTTPEAASTYGNRVLRSEITPGKTAEFDAREMFLNDPEFKRRAIESGVNPEMFEAAQEEYRATEARNRDTFKQAGVEYQPDPVPPSTNARSVLMKMAREQGLDTATLKNVGDVGGGYDQIAVLNPKNVKFPELPTQHDRAVDVVRQAAGLDEVLPQRQYQTVEQPATAELPQPVKKGAGESGGDLVYRGHDAERGVDIFHDMGQSEGLGEVQKELQRFAPDDLTKGSSLMVEGVLKHLGLGDTPTYSVYPDHPAIEGNLGYYHPHGGNVVLRNTDDFGQMLRTTNHEALHAAFYHAINNTPEAKSAVGELLREAKLNDYSTDGSYPVWHEGIRYKSEHYGLTNEHEFISEAFTNPKFQEFLSKTKASPELLQRLGLENLPKSKIATMWDAFLMVARKAFGLDLTDANMSLLDATMKVGDRLTAAAEGMRREGGDGVLAQPIDPILERASALGMNRAQAQRYRELINRRDAEDFEARKAQIAAQERKTQTKEWKANEVVERKAAARDVPLRPDLHADTLLREGEKLDTDALSPEQRRVLGADHTRNGIDPDAFARFVGYDTADEMISAVGLVREARGDQRPTEYIRDQITAETNRRMEAKYGNLDQNIISAAKEQVLSETQMDLLRAEAEAAAGGPIPVSKAAMEANVKRVVGELKLSEVSSDGAIAAAGRAGRAIEDLLLKGDAKGAYEQRMRQVNALLGAKEMQRIEKARAGFDKITKRFAAREVPGAAQEYVDQLHGAMVRLGLGIKRSVQDLQEALEGSATPTFEKFVADRQDVGARELHVPDFMLDPNFRKNLGDLTVEEFDAVHDMFKAMTFNARDEQKIIRSGEKADFVATRDEIIQKIERQGRKEMPLARPSMLSKAPKSFGWSLVNLETMLNRLDFGERESGVINQAVIRHYTEAANYRDKLFNDFAKDLRGIGKIDNLGKAVKNDLFADPLSGAYFKMTRENVLGVLQNVGNPGNMKKLAMGYKVEPAAVMEWLFKNTTKEDWDRAQGIGDVFGKIGDMSDAMSRNISGVGLKKVELREIETPFGTYKGWYHPLKADERFGDKSVRGNPEALLEGGYYRATTPQGYTKGRTGVVYPVELNLNAVPIAMKQMIHDVAMRPAVIQLGKYFYDGKFQAAVRDYYGEHQAKQLIPFLKDMANAPNYTSSAAQIGNATLAHLMSNTTATLVGFNPSTVLKHGTTAALKSFFENPLGFGKELVTLFNRGVDGDRNWSMAMEKSPELQRRMTNWRDLIENSNSRFDLRSSSPSSYMKSARSFAMWAGGLPIGMFDMMSSVPTWLATYKDAIARGENEGNALYLADTSVRQTHGSSVFTNKPEIARSKNAVAQSFGKLYGFFSENLQKQYEILWRTKDAYGMLKDGEVKAAMKELPKVTALIFTSVILPAYVEELVSGEGDAKEGFGHRAARMLTHGLTSSIIGLRDWAYALSTGEGDPGAGMIPTMYKGFNQPFKDAHEAYKHGHVSPQLASKIIKDGVIATGYATGLTNATEAKAAQYVYNYFHGREHPKGVWDLATGLRFGESKHRTRTFEEWRKKEFGK